MFLGNPKGAPLGPQTRKGKMGQTNDDLAQLSFFVVFGQSTTNNHLAKLMFFVFFVGRPKTIT